MIGTIGAPAANRAGPALGPGHVGLARHRPRAALDARQAWRWRPAMKFPVQSTAKCLRLVHGAFAPNLAQNGAATIMGTVRPPIPMSGAAVLAVVALSTTIPIVGTIAHIYTRRKIALTNYVKNPAK